jgi:tRNA(Ile)-lysidine synthase
MSPLGFKGSRKLQDIFVDAKVPLSDRNGIPVFECAGEIFWLPGYRIAAGWEVTGGDASALQVEIERA